MIDRLLAELEKRMKAYDDISKTIGFLSELTSLNIEQTEDKATKSRFLVSRWLGRHTGGWAYTVCCIYAHSETGDCEQISRVIPCTSFCHCWIFLRHFQTSRLYMMVSNASGERSSSKFGIVKGKLRSWMGQKMLSMLQGAYEHWAWDAAQPWLHWHDRRIHAC